MCAEGIREELERCRQGHLGVLTARSDPVLRRRSCLDYSRLPALRILGQRRGQHHPE
jgi:hypothetical protein